MDEFKMEQYAVCKSRRAKKRHEAKKNLYTVLLVVKFFYIPVL